MAVIALVEQFLSQPGCGIDTLHNKPSTHSALSHTTHGLDDVLLPRKAHPKSWLPMLAACYGRTRVTLKGDGSAELGHRNPLQSLPPQGGLRHVPGGGVNDPGTSLLYTDPTDAVPLLM